MGIDLGFYFPLNFNLSQFPFILPTLPLLLPLYIFYTVNWDLPYKIKIHAHTYLCVYFVYMLQFWLIPFRSSQYPAAAAAAKSLQSCLTVWPHRRQPTRLPCPWDSPGKNTRVGCHFLSNAWKWEVKVKSLTHVQLFATPWTAAYQAPHPWDFPGKSSGVGCHCLLPQYPTSLLFKVWSVDQFQWHPFRACWKCRILSPLLELLSQNLCFSKITRWFVYSVAFAPLDLRIGLLDKVY